MIHRKIGLLKKSFFVKSSIVSSKNNV